MDSTYSAPPETGRIQRLSLIAGVIALLVLVVGWFFNHEQFFRSYLLGFVFWIGIALGSLALLMLQHLTGGAWGLVIRRVLEAASRTLPLMLLLFVPLIFGLGHVYHWIHPEQIAEETARRIVEAKASYLNVPFFLLRTALYFAIWIGLAYFLNKWSLEQDRTADKNLSKRFQSVSGPGIVLFVLTTTFASIDWVMSLDPEWFSTIFGLLFVAAWTLSAFAFMITVMTFLATRKPLEGIVAPAHFHDLGKLLLAFVMLWAYFAFSQFLIIWSGNLPEETKWYLHRLRGGWGIIGVALIVLHFALPFVLLLSRDLKRNARRLVFVAGLVLLMRFVDLFWLIVPEFHRGQFAFSWMDIIAPIGIGGIWLAFFAWQLQQRPLLPLNDPKLQEIIERGQEQAGH